MSAIEDLLARAEVSSVFQPIVDLYAGTVVAYEALARGPKGPLERPDQMFAAAREADCLAELDQACRTAAFDGAVRQGLLAPLTLFVNVEPEVLDTAPLDDLLRIAQHASGELRVVMEITERALTAQPAALLRTVERVRSFGWGVALDDVGAQALSLAFMPLLRPDVVKLDLRLVQERPGSAVAEIMNAVNAYAERSGALVLAEGIETERHLKMARALGARLGQGWMFGRPQSDPSAAFPVAELRLPAPQPPVPVDASPFAYLPQGTELRRSPKSLLIEVSKQLERQAMRLGETCVVASTFQNALHFTPATALRYRDLVKRVGFVCALGEDLPVEPVPGVRGATLSATDPVHGEWDVTVVGPHFAAALLARDLGDTGPDQERMFEYALTYDRDTVVRASTGLISRVVPRLPVSELDAMLARPSSSPVPAPVLAARPSAAGETLLHSALAATTCGVTIANVDRPDQPLVFVNAAFEQLSGFRSDEVLGGNCRFLQGPDTDPAAVERIRSAVQSGQECRETLLNYRGPERTPWWNEIHLAPVADTAGVVVQYIGVQNDVTGRVEAERALQQERDRATSYLARIEQLAFHDSLTGLPNRRRLEERLEAELWESRASGCSVALLFLDLDGFKSVNDLHGHSAGDELLVETAHRLRARCRRGDLLARLGGDEFLVVVPGLEPATAAAETARISVQLAATVGSPLTISSGQVRVDVSIGLAIYPQDGHDFRTLLHRADQHMYANKRAKAPAAAQ